MNIVIDISHYEAVSDWVRVKEQVDGVYLKATQRHNWFDATFKTYRQGCENNNIKWGAYHFYEITSTGLAQADFMLSIMGSDIGKLPIALDYEPKYIGQFPTRTNALASIKSFMSRIEDRTGTKPIFYSNIDHINDLKPIPDWLLEHGLWIASYSSKEPVTPWAKWVMWQFTDAGSIDGIEDAVDFNHATDEFLGNVTQPPVLDDAEKLDRLWDLHPELHYN